MSARVRPTKVTAIVYGAKGLKSKKKGKHKFCTIIGIGSNKFRTEVIEELNGNPTFNTECEINVDDPTLPVIFLVTEKHEKDVLGQVTVPLADLVSFRTNRPDHVALQPHKKCPKPDGELILEVYVSASTVVESPQISVTAAPDDDGKKHLFSLKKLKEKMQSPMLSRKSSGKEHKRTGSDHGVNSMKIKGSMSCHDLMSITAYNPAPFGTNLKVSNSDSLSSLESITESQSAAHQEPEVLKPEVTGVSPKEGPIEGGTKITIRGTNLGVNREDVIGLFVCGSNVLGTLEYHSSSKLTCITKAWKPGVGNVTLETQSGGKGVSLVQFTFIDKEAASDTSSEVGSVSLSRSSSRGDADVRRDDGFKGSTDLKRDDSLKSKRDSLIRALTPPIKSSLRAKSMFDLSGQQQVAVVKPPVPEVSGISPKEGSVEGGTRVTIRGSNLGQSKSDVVGLAICGVDCLASVEYESSSKLLCTTGPGRLGSGDIVVETVGGGKGVSMVKFSYFESREEQWAAVPYEDETAATSPTQSVYADDNRSSTPGRLQVPVAPKQPPPVVEIQPMSRRPPPSPKHQTPLTNATPPPKPERAEKNKANGDSQISTHVGQSNFYDEEKTVARENPNNERITELNRQLGESEDRVKQLLLDNKLLKEENERMRKYMENLVSRAIVQCPSILCVDNKAG